MFASSVDMTAGTPGDMYFVDKHEKCLKQDAIVLGRAAESRAVQISHPTSILYCWTKYMCCPKVNQTQHMH